MEKQIISVGQINEYLKLKLDSDSRLSNIAIRGEISNYKIYPSGHHYFTLKDEQGAIRCVMFRSNSGKLRFRPENGMKVIAMGSITVYVRDGAYQLYCTSMTMDGIGDLYAAFEQLKKDLAAKGLFDQSHKKALPKYPGTIGIITSEAGAAVHDMLRILRKRYPLTQVRLLPVRVQGAEAPGEIAAAIRYANHFHLADLLIVGRGGGSIEDLWAFNDELVAKAIYLSEIPVISAVGHEPDITISDYVADLRAATPSNGAELAVPDQDALRQQLDSLQQTLVSTVMQNLKRAEEKFNYLAKRPVLQSPAASFEQRRKQLELLNTRMSAAQAKRIGQASQQFVSAASKLDALSPLKVLTRGYAMVHKENGALVRSVDHITKNEKISVRLSDGIIYASVMEGEKNHE